MDDAPMLARWGSPDPSMPLVVGLHGNGTSEHSLIEISPWLPHGPVAYVSVRAPIASDLGWTWFVDDASLAESIALLLRWLPTEGDPDRPVLLLGYREGVMVAGGMMLAAPELFAGAVLLHGAFPRGVTGRGRLAGLPMFLAHGTDDSRTPAAELTATWDWLTRESGAPVWAERGPGGTGLAGKIVGDVGTWLADRLDHLRAHGENPLPDGDEPCWPSLDGLLPCRTGPPPEVTTVIPQHQLTQNAPAAVAAELWSRLTGLPGVTTAPATVGVPGTRSLLLDRAETGAPDSAFLLPDLGEFAHLHPGGDLHVVLPPALAYDALAKGWAVAHPLAGIRVTAGMLLVPGPRDAAELEIVTALVHASHHQAAHNQIGDTST